MPEPVTPELIAAAVQSGAHSPRAVAQLLNVSAADSRLQATLRAMIVSGYLTKRGRVGDDGLMVYRLDVGPRLIRDDGGNAAIVLDESGGGLITQRRVPASSVYEPLGVRPGRAGQPAVEYFPAGPACSMCDGTERIGCPANCGAAAANCIVCRGRGRIDCPICWDEANRIGPVRTDVNPPRPAGVPLGGADVEDEWLTGDEVEDWLTRDGRCPYQTSVGGWGQQESHCGALRSPHEGDWPYCRVHATEIRRDRGYGGYVA